MPDLARYRHLLQAHDWTHEYSDDHSVWRRGQTQLAELKTLQPSLDPDYSVWNSIAPRDYQRNRNAKA